MTKFLYIVMYFSIGTNFATIFFFVIKALVKSKHDSYCIYQSIWVLENGDKLLGLPVILYILRMKYESKSLITSQVMGIINQINISFVLDVCIRVSFETNVISNV